MTSKEQAAKESFSDDINSQSRTDHATCSHYFVYNKYSKWLKSETKSTKYWSRHITPSPYPTFIVVTLVQSSQCMHQSLVYGAVWLRPNSPECRCNVRVSNTQVRLGLTAPWLVKFGTPYGFFLPSTSFRYILELDFNFFLLWFQGSGGSVGRSRVSV